MPESIAQAEELSRSLLALKSPRRWAHVAAVARRAEAVSGAHKEGDLLRIAAWTHDVGYAQEVARTGFHPLDGAQYLRQTGWPARLVGLVAYHSSAFTEAEVFGVGGELAEFDDERTLTRDLLWYLDMTTGPDGQALSFSARMAEIRERYTRDHYVIQALDLGMGERIAAVERATEWLSSVGLDHV